MSFTFAYDVTGLFFSQVPQGFQLCGYDTGESGVPWTAGMWEAHPGAVHIDQAPDTAGDVTADVLDCEVNAVPVGSPLIATWAKGAHAAYNSAKRPGQRMPAIYCSLSNVTMNVNALIKGGVSSGVGLWIAEWGIPTSQAVAALAQASGPFPIIGFQVADEGDYDLDIFSTSWLDTVSAAAWVFGPCRGVQFKRGNAGTFTVHGYAPSTPQNMSVGEYQFAAFAGTTFGHGPQLNGYPVLQHATGLAFTYTGMGMTPGKPVTVGVRALSTTGGHAGPWVTGTVVPGP